MPLKAVNEESLHRKQKAPKGWPTSFHKWWAQRPLAACRAVIFASLVDDPSARPEKFPTAKAQAAERNRLMRLLEELIKWDNSQDEVLLASAWKEILSSSDGNPPAVWDPFAGSGSIPLEAQRLGLHAHASDLNPVAVVINKALLEIPYVFRNRAPVNPAARIQSKIKPGGWSGARGLAADVRHYAEILKAEAWKALEPVYPTARLALGAQNAKTDVVAWIWARTLICPNPACGARTPVVRSFVLSNKKGRETWVEPQVEGKGVRFSIRRGEGDIPEGNKTREGARCLMCMTYMDNAALRTTAKTSLDAQLMAVVADTKGGRIFLPPESTVIPALPRPSAPEVEQEMADNPRWFSPPGYGLVTYADLFTNRQLLAYSTFSNVLQGLRITIQKDAEKAGLPPGEPIASGGSGAKAYAEAIQVYLAFILDRMVFHGTTLTTWLPKDSAVKHCMPRQALAMTWDFAEANPFGKSSGGVGTCTSSIASYLEIATPRAPVVAEQRDARTISGTSFLFSTDPPYYDNIGYADLSDFFYVWLRKALKPVFPSLFNTLVVPKAEELVATPYRHGSKEKAETFFMKGMTQAMGQLARHSNPAYPVTIYYAFKQTEGEDDAGTSSTGWETFLESVIGAGLTVAGTWPMRTEGAERMIAKGTNALASSIVLVCRPRPATAPVSTRQELIRNLKAELPSALKKLQQGNIAPVDLAQAAIGPGMAVYSRYAHVIEASGSSMPVRTALQLINQVLDEVLAEQESEFDAETRWAIGWFDQNGMATGSYGEAETLSKAKNTSVRGLVEAGLLESRQGKVRLLKRAEMPPNYDPATNSRVTVWEITQHLIRRLMEDGEPAAAELAAKAGGLAEVAKDLAYRLYTTCERKGWSQEAIPYNALVTAWPEISRLASGVGKKTGLEAFG